MASEMSSGQSFKMELGLNPLIVFITMEDSEKKKKFCRFLGTLEEVPYNSIKKFIKRFEMGKLVYSCFGLTTVKTVQIVFQKTITLF